MNPSKSALSDPRTRLLETAARLFREQGYNGTGINQLIAESGIAKASFYHHFPGKEDLFIAVLGHLHEAWLSDLEGALAIQPTASEKIRELFRLQRKTACGPGATGCAFQNAAGEFPLGHPRVREAIQAHRAGLARMQRELISEHFETRGFGRDAVEAAEELAVLLEGGMKAAHMTGDPAPIEAAERVAEERFRLDP